MAEALGIASSIIAIVQAAQFVTDFIKTAHDAPVEVTKLSRELETLEHLLESSDSPGRLGIELNGSESSAVLKDLKVEISNLQAVLEEYKKGLETSEGDVGCNCGALKGLQAWCLRNKTRVEWPWCEKVTQKSLDAVTRGNQRLQVAMQIDHERYRALKDEFLRGITNKPPKDRHRIVQSDICAGTGEWLLHSPAFVSWRDNNSPSSILLGLGKAGAGKTHLSAIVIEHLIESEGNNVAFVYFEYQEQEQQTSIDVLSSLLKQFLGRMPVPPEIMNLYLTSKESLPSQEQLMKMLSIIPSKVPKAFIVFDGLDEMKHRDQRDKLIPLLCRLKDSHFRLFLTSRPDPSDVKDAFQNHASFVDIKPSAEDLEKYVRKRLESCNSTFTSLLEKYGEQEAQDSIVKTVVDSGKEIFLIVRLNMNHILDCQTPADLKQTLALINEKELADEDELEGVYDVIMQRIEAETFKKSKIYAYRILSWLCGSARTLEVEELRDIVLVDPDHPEDWNHDHRLDVSQITNLCKGLVVIDEATGQVRMLHFSVSNYLERTIHRHPSFAQMGPEYRARACLSFFRIEAVKELTRGFLEPSEPRNPIAFTKYAAEYLEFHLSRSDQRLIQNDFLQFIQCSESRLSYIRAYPQRPSIWEDLIPDFPPKSIKILDMAAYLGQNLAVRSLLRSSVPNFSADRHTSLLWGARKGYLDVVQEIVDFTGVDISAKACISRCRSTLSDPPLFTAVEVATKYRQEEIRIFLERYGGSQVHV